MKRSSVFIKLFLSVMLALAGFAAAMLILILLLNNASNDTRHNIVATQILYQIEPILVGLNENKKKKLYLESRYLLSALRYTFSVYDESLNIRLGLYDAQTRKAILVTQGLPDFLPSKASLWTRLFMNNQPNQFISIQADSPLGFVLLYQAKIPKKTTISPWVNIFTGTILLLLIMAGVLWVIAKTMTWRINQLSRQIVQFGEGNFSARVTPVGNDEITVLAKGFNHTAERIEKLINASELLLAHVSHEIRTPITRMFLQIEMMDSTLQCVDENNKQKLIKRTDAIHRDLKNLNDLVENILLFSRLNAGQLIEEIDKVKKIDICSLIEEEVYHYPQSHFYGSQLIIEGQKELLTHCIRNLLENVYRHGEPPVEVYLYAIDEQGQRISDLEKIELYHDLLDDDLFLTKNQTFAEDYKKNPNALTENSPELSTEKNKFSKGFFSRKKMVNNMLVKQDYQAIQIAVIDQGHGIPIDKREEIFKPFVRLKQEKKGTGLGLSLVAKIVNAHRGQIITDTYENKTRFLITLPTKQNNQELKLPSPLLFDK